MKCNYSIIINNVNQMIIFVTDFVWVDFPFFKILIIFLILNVFFKDNVVSTQFIHILKCKLGPSSCFYMIFILSESAI